MSRYPLLPDYIDDAMRSFGRLREQTDMLANISDIYRPAMEGSAALERQISALMSNPTDLARQQNQMLNALNGHSKLLTDQILGSTRLDSAINDQLRAIIQPSVVQETFGLFDRLGVQQRSISQAFNGALAGIGAYQDIEAIFGAVRQPAIQREVEKMLDLVRGIGPVSFDAVAQTLSVGGATFPISEFGDQLGEAAAEAEDASDSARLKVFLQIVLAHSARLKGNTAVAFTLVVLLWLAKTVFEGQIQTVSGEILRPVTDSVIRKLKPNVREHVETLRHKTPLVDVRSIRLVAATNLQVRVAPRRDNSRIVSRLSAPAVVIVVRQEKDWTLVQYKDGDVIVRGWVFSRYLAKIDA